MYDKAEIFGRELLSLIPDTYGIDFSFCSYAISMLGSLSCFVKHDAEMT